MAKYAYAYFGSNGELKEFIIDPSAREGNVQVNKIYIYWEGQPEFELFGLSYINTSILNPQWSAAVTATFLHTNQSFSIPVMEDYDPKVFQYGKTYVNDENGGVYLLDIPQEVLETDGDIALSLFAFDDEDNDNVFDPETDTLIVEHLGLITFHVEETGARFPVYIDKSQYYLLSIENNEIKNRLDVLATDVAGKLDRVDSGSGTNGLFKVYAVSSNGDQTMLYATSSIRTLYSDLVLRDSVHGNITVPLNPGSGVVANNNATSKKYVDDADALKVDKTTDIYKVYGTDGSGNQTTYTIDSGNYSPIANTVVRRSSHAEVLVPATPTSLYASVSKQYADKLAKSLEVSIDSSTYVMTMVLKDVNGNVLSTQTVDLPLESMVVSGRYDDESEEIILTLQNGEEIEIPVSDLVSGLISQSDLQTALASYYTKTEVDTALSAKQATLVSGGNIKTINSNSILGSGDLELYTVMNTTTDLDYVMED